jgi:WD40 repeat protein
LSEGREASGPSTPRFDQEGTDPLSYDGPMAGGPWRRRAEQAATSYDAFLSYSHADESHVVEALQHALRLIGKPWYRRQALRVFRDQTNLSANPRLWSSISETLDRSEWFVLLASPEAATSLWVDREVAYWLEHRDPNRLLVVVTGGEWVWDDAAGDFDRSRSTATPPSLFAAFSEEPRHIDLRWAHDEGNISARTPRLRDQAAEIAAPIHHVSKEDLVGDDLRQHRRTVRTARAAGAVLVLLLVVASVAAVNASRSADRARESEARAQDARRESDYERLVAQARDLRRSRLDVALLLAVEARHRRDTPESRGAIQAALLQDPSYLGPVVDDRIDGGFFQVCPLEDGRTAVTGAEDGTWGVVDLVSGRPDGPRERLASSQLADLGSFVGCALDPSGGTGVLFTRAGSVWPFDARERRTGTPIDLGRPLNGVSLSPDGRLAAAGTTDGTAIVWPLSSPNEQRIFVEGEAGDSVATAFSAASAMLATTTETEIIVRDTATWDVVRRFDDPPSDQAGGLVDLPEGLRILAFSGDGRHLLNSRRGVVRVHDALSGAIRWTRSNSYTEATPAAFAPDDRSVFVQGDEGLVERLDTRSGSPLATPIRPPGVGWTATADRDGTTLLIAGADVWRWALDERSLISRFISAPGKRAFTDSPDGQSLVVTPAGSQFVTEGEVLDTRTGQSLWKFPLVAYPTLLDARTFGGFFVADLAVDRVDVSTGTHVGPRFTVPIQGATAAVVGDHGEILIGYSDGSVRRFTPDGREIGDPWLSLRTAPSQLDFSPRADLVSIMLGFGDAVRIHRTSDGSLAHEFAGVIGGLFSADGSVVGVLTADARLELRDTDSFALVGAVRMDPTLPYGNVRADHYLMGASSSRAQLVDKETLRAVGETFPSEDVPVLFRNGDMLATNTPAGIVLWDLNPDHWETAACRMAGRNLTADEWATYFPADEPRATCADWPAPR